LFVGGGGGVVLCCWGGVRGGGGGGGRAPPPRQGCETRPRLELNIDVDGIVNSDVRLDWAADFWR